MYYRFMFQQSYIWEAGDSVDPNTPVALINARSEARARRHLPDIPLGRKWILIGSEPKD